ncbi:hypothetical protein KUTeg_007282 [Tegillarca granosa]|uniref:Core-binding (CB) domain-containing protein n=1 Tax=Tegillarca granosa TaxID=220873 RepID=A0ABQ9FGX9_TEGGR|nr:hypothetical protein KUTeg_007282 [Tegillarca granosa]
MEKFKIGETVTVGRNGQKGKIVNTVRPFGESGHKMYKSQLYSSGEIISAATHELIKGLPDEDFLFQCLFDNYGKNTQTETCNNSQQLPSNTVNPPPQAFDKNELYAEVDLDSFLLILNESKEIHKETRFIDDIDVDEFIKQNENQNTLRKTLGHLRVLKSFLLKQNELREIHEIPPIELNEYLAKFLISVRKKGGKEYEPSTLRGMLGSFGRYLRRHNYSTSIISGFEFSKCRESLKFKQKDLKSKGFGNRPKAADAITQDEIDTLYKCGLLGTKHQRHC